MTTSIRERYQRQLIAKHISEVEQRIVKLLALGYPLTAMTLRTYRSDPTKFSIAVRVKAKGVRV